MSEKYIVNETGSLKKLFQSDKNQNNPFIYLPIDSENDLNSKEKLSKLISSYRKSGFGGIVPFCNKNYKIDALSDEYYEVYKIIEGEVRNSGISLGYLDDTYVMREYISAQTDPSAVQCRILNRYEISCTEGQKLKKTLHTDGTRMSVVAVNDDDLTILDLRKYIKDDVLEWTVPSGNWNIEEYICEADNTAVCIDLLDYDICSDYLKSTFGKLINNIKDSYSTSSKNTKDCPFDVFMYRDIAYTGQNRRMWHPEFNHFFEERYGFDPAPYYTLMFRHYPGYSDRYRCMLMSCRFRMLSEGYLKAAADYCRSKSVFCSGFPSEGKTTACSWMFGDGMMFHKYASAPGVSMPFAYLYGINGIRVASSAGDMFGCETVTADLFKHFSQLPKDVIYREAMNVYSRGANMVFAHLGEDRIHKNNDKSGNENSSWGAIFSKGDDLTDFALFATRVQALLRGGEHVSEAAIVYPIHTLHSMSYLYHSDIAEFEYPSTPEDADYMDIMNDFLSYVGIDTVFLHPNTITEKSYPQDGILYLSNDRYTSKIKLLILPSMNIISLKALRVIKKFFDEGGKIIATNLLPLKALESSVPTDDINNALKTESAEDREVREIIEYLFGSDVTDSRTYRSYYKNANEKGGTAYFFPSNITEADGSSSVSARYLYQAVSNFGFAPDVYIDKMPRREFFGLVNYNLPDFLKVGVDKRLAKGCSMNYIHKKYAGHDIYYFTNTASSAYRGSVLLKGRHTPEEWNPYNGKTSKIISTLVRFRGEIYTMIDLSLEASNCTFIVSATPKNNNEVLRDIEDEELIPEFFAFENF